MEGIVKTLINADEIEAFEEEFNKAEEWKRSSMIEPKPIYGKATIGFHTGDVKRYYIDTEDKVKTMYITFTNDIFYPLYYSEEIHNVLKALLDHRDSTVK